MTNVWILRTGVNIPITKVFTITSIDKNVCHVLVDGDEYLCDSIKVYPDVSIKLFAFDADDQIYHAKEVYRRFMDHDAIFKYFE